MNLDFLINDSNSDEKDVYKSIFKDAKDYADLQLQLFKLNMVDKLSQILSYLVVIVAGALLLMTAFIFFSMVFVLWMKDVTGSMMYGFLILGGFFILLFLLFLALRKKVMINPIIKKMSSILFKDAEEIEEVEDEE